ncbi:unnamed protein product [Polarella glacialis]|uniref:NFACT protein C-terminal domain-containing protein n=1 Tax=Polarella glacialis TaxID=89957 RepID=A0A813KFI0_POLGL|nr:unnamed protein product [Polarella glacialis]
MAYNLLGLGIVAYLSTVHICRTGDEEERELRLALLGSKATKRAGGGESGGGGDGIGRRASDGEGSEATPVPEAAEGTPAESGRTPASASRPGGNGSAAGGGGGSEPSERRPPPPRRQPPAGGSGAALEVLTAGCEADGGSADSLPIGRLDLLTGQPQTEDEVSFALAMVAPFCSLSGPYALRIKLSPGNQKKGQAVRQCMKIFQEQLQRREWKQLVQAIPENEAMDKMCGSCKLSMPGLQKLQQVLRKEKKKEGKDLDKQHGAPKSEPKKPEKKAQKK